MENSKQMRKKDLLNGYNKYTSLAAKFQIECIGSIEMEKGLNGEGVDVCIYVHIIFKEKSSRKHWYQSHSHTHSNNQDMGCGVQVWGA
jgi:hypothetical protein